MDLTTVLLLLLLLVAVAAGVLAWLLYGPRGTARQRPVQSAEQRKPQSQPAEPERAPTAATQSLPAETASEPAATQQLPANTARNQADATQQLFVAPAANRVATTQLLPAARVALPEPATESHEPAEQLLAALSTRLVETTALVRTLPRSFDDRSTLMVGIRVVEQELDELRSALNAQTAHDANANEIRFQRVRRRLDSIRQDAKHIVLQLTELTTLEMTIHEDVAALAEKLNSVRRLQPFPLVADQTSVKSARALSTLALLPDREQVTSLDKLRMRLQLVKEINRNIAECRGALETALRQRETLLDLLEGPELAEKPSWHQSLGALRQRFERDERNGAGPAQAAKLLAQGDTILARRRALLALNTPLSHDGAALHEAQLPVLLAEAEAIRAEVHSLWQQARLLASRLKS